MNASDFLAQLIESSLAVSLLIAVILLIRKPVARRFGPEAAYLLWLAPALRLVLPDLPAPPLLPAPAAEGGVTFSFAGAGTGSVAPAVASLDLAPVILALWAAGSIAFLLMQLVRQRRFSARVIAGAVAPSPRLAAEAAAAADEAGLRRSISVLIAADQTGPLVCGLMRPVIILPSNFESAFAPGERRGALAHECAHLKRGDLFSALVAICFRALQWPNPLAHIAFLAFRADQEAACDASVLRKHESVPDFAHAYGAAMLRSAANAAAAPAASLAMSRHLKERLMLMKAGTRRPARRARILGATLALIGLAASAGYSQAEERKEERVVVKTSAVSIIKVDGGESIEYAGVKNGKKVEIRKENDAKTVRVYDGDGKLLVEKVYLPGEAGPADSIIIRNKDGKTRTLDPDAPPGPPAAPMAPTPPGAGKLDCESRGGVFTESEKTDADGKRTVSITCIVSSATGDPKARAEALRATIAKLEKDSDIPTDQRAAMIAKLREKLAAVEKEAAGQ